ncbi:hypothetical protein J31TS6_16500 [Brevibacillus reuszeri]|uniref:hypothetical protein n=1 Tax=Brevibacillus reuszeri TaxID=54915 RepID=UPI001B03ABBC|nr:hypothetical protein [Brevibacillus reuszeri]GIO05622.1 hypothetical protein J31TS6_16500 [Brevibacillus reuszeri]
MRDVLLYSAILAVPVFCFTFLFVSPFLHEKGMAIEWLGLVFILIQGMSILGSIILAVLVPFFGKLAEEVGYPVLCILIAIVLISLPVVFLRKENGTATP